MLIRNCYFYFQNRFSKSYSPLISWIHLLKVNESELIIFQIRAEAAYLYDAVQLYAKALIKVLDNGDNPRNGTAVIDALKGTHYKSAMGWVMHSFLWKEMHIYKGMLNFHKVWWRKTANENRFSRLHSFNCLGEAYQNIYLI